MKNRINPAIIIALVLPLVLCPVSGADAYTREEASAGGPYLFQAELPFQYAINDSCAGPGVPKEKYSEAVKNSYISWTVPSCTYFSVAQPPITGRTDTGYNPDGDNLNLVVWRTSEWATEPRSYPKNALAITTNTFFTDSGTIVKSDIEVNGEFFTWRVLDSAGSGYNDIQNTLTHEAGHVTGLDHSSDPKAVMYYAAKSGEISKRVLTQDDIDGVCAIYPAGGPDAGENDGSPDPTQSSGCACSAIAL
ncbi:MAG: matrixin family metalloprotease [Myxococcota bacterium]|jgi:hypothetical protein